MKRIAFLLIFLIGCTGVSYHETTDAGEKYVLTNGMTVILKPNPDTGMVAIDTLFGHSIAADGNLPGLSQFTNRMLLAGTTTRSREDIAAAIEGAGGSINTRTYAEYSELTIEVPSNQVSIALEILADVLQNPAFIPEEIEKERATIIGELESKKDDPNVQSEELFMATLYEGTPYANPIDGYVESIKKITRKDLLEHYHQWYVPNNIIIGIAGNIRPKTLIRTLSMKTKKMQPLDLPKLDFELPRNIAPEQNTNHMDLESFYIQQGYQTIPATHPDFIKTRAMQSVLGSGSGSRLFYELRDKRALAYSVYAIAPSIRNGGFLKISMISRPDVLNQSLLGIKEQIDRLKNEQVPEDELDIVKQKMRGFFFLDHQRSRDQANYLAFYELQGLGYHFDVEYPGELSQVTPGDVQYAASKYLNNPATAIVGPFEEAKIE